MKILKSIIFAFFLPLLVVYLLFWNELKEIGGDKNGK
jgi:hypothetical protein